MRHARRLKKCVLLCSNRSGNFKKTEQVSHLTFRTGLEGAKVEPSWNRQGAQTDAVQTHMTRPCMFGRRIQTTHGACPDAHPILLSILSWMAPTHRTVALALWLAQYVGVPAFVDLGAVQKRTGRDSSEPRSEGMRHHKGNKGIQVDA
jgi:hypothetical protein